MNDRNTDRLIESLSELTDAVTELAVKVKRLTNSNPITPEKYNYIKNKVNGKI